MKKLYTIAIALAATMTMGAQTVSINGTSYDNIAAAVEAATDGATITITGTHEFSGSRINLNQDKSLTFKGEGDATILRGEGNKTNLFFLLDKATTTFENITFDGNNVEGTTQKMVEAKNGAHLTMTNCTFTNLTKTAVQVKANVTLNGIQSNSNSLAEGEAVVFVGQNNGLTIAGNSEYSIFIEKGFTVKGGENIAGKVEILLPADKFTPGYKVISNCTTPEFFTLVGAPEGYTLVANNGNLEIAYNKLIVKNETLGTSYSSLQAAYDAAAAAVEDGTAGGPQTLVILEDVVMNDRIVNRVVDLTIQGLNPDVKIIRNFKNKLLFSAEKPMTLQYLVIDGNNVENNNSELELNSTLNLTGVKFINNATQKSLINVKNNMVLNMTDCTVEGELAVPGIYMAGNPDQEKYCTVNLQGNNNLTVTNANENNSLKAGTMTNVDPIQVTMGEAVAMTEGLVIVKDCTDTSKFSLTNEGWSLKAEGGNLVATTGSGIESAVADEAETVNVYTLQGVLVKKNISRASAAENLPAGLYIIGDKKVVVK